CAREGEGYGSNSGWYFDVW
nr:immunoglobulin heavy chain junction region [Macaca mulatta]